MGQKVNPIGFRLGVNKTWSSKWYVDPKEYAETLHEDLALRKALMKCPEVQGAEISNVEISRKPQRVTVLISTSRPGVIIGTKGANIEKICEQLQKVSTKKVQVKIKSLEHALFQLFLFVTQLITIVFNGEYNVIILLSVFS